MKTTETAPLMSLTDIAALLGVHYETVRRMEADNALPEPVLPKHYRARWRRTDITAWLGIDVEGDRL